MSFQTFGPIDPLKLKRSEIDLLVIMCKIQTARGGNVLYKTLPLKPETIFEKRKSET